MFIRLIDYFTNAQLNNKWMKLKLKRMGTEKLQSMTSREKSHFAKRTPQKKKDQLKKLCIEKDQNAAFHCKAVCLTV